MKINFFYKIHAAILLIVFMSATAYAFLGGLKWTGTIEARVDKVTWEYRVISLTDAKLPVFENELNELGRDGWELGALVTTQTGGYYVMKRPQSA
ncbi:MAG: hypothetical protein HY587_06915 [Candidatus Omnitrophica bacterium]|nr:hypothetical protein [Candidatus Omnitrophota bacterium]